MNAYPPKQAPLEKVRLPPLPERPLVSIIVPSFNQGRYIRETIESILEQDYRPIEIHIIDGGSTDNTLEVLKSFSEIPELSWISEPDSGPAHAVNKGFERIKGNICAIQSSDDLYLPGAFSDAVAMFSENQTVALVYGDVVKIDEHGREFSRSSIYSGTLCDFLAKRTWIPQQTAFFRAELIQELGGWNVDLPYTPDVDFWMRSWFRHPAVKIDRYWGSLRVHKDQRDKHHHKIRRDWAAMIRTSKDVNSANFKTRVAAKSGNYMNAVRYGSGNDWKDTGNLWLAIFFWPLHFSSAPVYWRKLIPGYISLLKLLSRIKQLLIRLGHFHQ